MKRFCLCTIIWYLRRMEGTVQQLARADSRSVWLGGLPLEHPCLSGLTWPARLQFREVGIHPVWTPVWTPWYQLYKSQISAWELVGDQGAETTNQFTNYWYRKTSYIYNENFVVGWGKWHKKIYILKIWSLYILTYMYYKIKLEKYSDHWVTYFSFTGRRNCIFRSGNKEI